LARLRNTVFSTWRGVAPFRWSLDRTTLILAYHQIPSAAGFARQIAVLQDLGLRVLSPAAAARAVAAGAVPPRSVVLTFDDCTLDQFERAAPVLCRSALPAGFYAPLAFLGERSTWTKQTASESPAPVMDASRLRALAAQGFEVGSHGLDHTTISDLSAAQQRTELVESKARLEDLLAAPVAGFCFPYGDVPAGAASRAAAAGYAYALGTDRRPVGLADDCFRLPRLSVLGDPAPQEFRAYLDGSILPYWAVRRRTLHALHRLRRATRHLAVVGDAR
jgi:peptidoglycan/xylan/chitin deacetylase (PgdA/CDA1 family)